MTSCKLDFWPPHTPLPIYDATILWQIVGSQVTHPPYKIYEKIFYGRGFQVNIIPIFRKSLTNIFVFMATNGLIVL